MSKMFKMTNVICGTDSNGQVTMERQTENRLYGQRQPQTWRRRQEDRNEENRGQF